MREIYRAPLGKSVTAYAYSVAILRKERFDVALSDDVAVKNVADYLTYVFKIVSVVYKRLVKGC